MTATSSRTEARLRREEEVIGDTNDKIFAAEAAAREQRSLFAFEEGLMWAGFEFHYALSALAGCSSTAESAARL